MMLLIRGGSEGRTMTPYPYRRVIMQWETPVAIDLRFGMEITMYIANR
jgi:coenzyme PQQ precursor peptide PqqA